MKASAMSVLTTLASGATNGASAFQQPNILLVMTDQQFADAMSCVMGQEFIHTPNMDYLAQNGMRFTRAYTPNPLCMPMRTSMFTGRYPHQTGVQTNDGPHIDPDKHVFMGKIFKDAGYETAYFGKWHIAFGSARKDIHGFQTFVGNDAMLDPEPMADFLRQPHEHPFLAVASFLGPHEICQWARKEAVPGEPLAEPPLCRSDHLSRRILSRQGTRLTSWRTCASPTRRTVCSRWGITQKPIGVG